MLSKMFLLESQLLKAFYRNLTRLCNTDPEILVKVFYYQAFHEILKRVILLCGASEHVILLVFCYLCRN